MPEKKLIEVTVEKPDLEYAKRLRLQKKKLNFSDEERILLKVNLVTRRWSMVILNGILQLLMSTVEQL